MPCEPGVRLDRDRVVAKGLGALLDRGRQPGAVALGREVAGELADEQPAVREDQDAEVSRRLDESRRRDGLAGRRRVAEPVAPRCTGIVTVVAGLVLDVVDEAGILVLVFLDIAGLGIELDGRLAVPVAAPVLLCSSLVRGDQLGEHPRQRVDLMAAQLGAGRSCRLRRREDSLETEHQAVADLPAGGRLLVARLDLRQRVVERRATRGPRCQDVERVLVGMEERLAVPCLRPERRSHKALGLLRRGCRVQYRFGHVRSTPVVLLLEDPARLGRSPAAGVA